MANKKGFYLVLLSSLMFGSYGVWSRLMGDYFGPFYQGWTRGLIILLILVPYLLWKKQIVPIKRKDWGWFATFMCFTSLTQAPLYYAFNHLDIGTATVLFYAAMLLTMYVVGFSFLGEKLTKVKVIAFLVACLGLFVTFSFSLLSFSLFAASMAILNGVASGTEVSSSKKLTGHYSALYVTWLSWLMVVLTNLPVSIMLGETQFIPTLSIEWAYQLGYIVASLIAFWAVIEGFKYIEASIGGLLGLLEIIFGILFGILLFQEVLTLRMGIGTLLVISAAALPHIAQLWDKLRN